MEFIIFVFGISIIVLAIKYFINATKETENYVQLRNNKYDKIKSMNNFDKIYNLNFETVVNFGKYMNEIYLAFNNKNKQIVYKNTVNEYTINYNDITDVEILDAGRSVLSLSNIIEGSIIGGSVGAIILGSKKNEKCNSLDIKISLNDFNTPCRVINLVRNVYKGSSEYNDAYRKSIDIIETIKFIISNKSYS